MFSPRTRPLALDAERLLGLRLSLNTPVVATPELPSGPARAALVSHAEAGLRCITVAVRSLRNGATVLYELEGMDLDATLDFSVAMDAALSFAETMGFLFDDDEVARGGDAAQALRRWREIMGPAAARVQLEDTGAQVAEEAPAPPVASRAEQAARAGREIAELLLEDVAEETVPEFEVPGDAVRAPELEADEAPGLEAAADPAGPDAGSTLTKFRPPEPEKKTRRGARAQGRERAGATALGRVQLVRRRAPAAPERASPMLRLLACF